MGIGGHCSGLGRLLLRVTAMPMFGNSQTDDPSRAWVTGRTCSLRIGVYRSACLRDRVPLRGKGTSDRLPAGISGKSGEGVIHPSVGSSSGSAMGPSDSAGVDCGRLETSAGHDIGSVSTSGLSVKPTDNSWSGPEGDSKGASNNASGISGCGALAVKDSPISTGSSVVLEISVWGPAILATGAGSGIEGEISTGSCIGGEMSTMANVWSWRTGREVCISWSRYCIRQSVSIQLCSCSPKSG